VVQDARHATNSPAQEQRHQGNLVVEALRWPTARQEDGESCGNHPGVVDSLTGATKLWGTPQAHERQADPRKVDHGVQLANQQARMFPSFDNVSSAATGSTPSADDTAAPTATERDSEMTMFPTPASRDYRTPNKLSYQDRSGTTKGEQLQNFVEHNWPTPRSADRTSRASMTVDGHWSAPSLEQVAELASGELPREFLNESELTPQARRIYDQARFLASLPALQIQDGQLSSESAPTSRQLWPTPTPEEAAGFEKKQTRRLNPRFVEWLMGFPLGWTERCKTAPSD
jgi:hypothetical protein